MNNISNSQNIEQYTSTGRKVLIHQEAVESFKNGQGKPIVSHIMPTDICNHSCAFCSVLTRVGFSLKFKQIQEYLEQIVPLGLKSVIVSGGGNPILYRDKEAKITFNEFAEYIKSLGLEMGLITNGMPLADFDGRRSWKGIKPSTLDLFSWIRISMSGLDHEEKEVFVPDIDPSKTTLGFSYVYHDIYYDDAEENHGKVSTLTDIITPLTPNSKRIVLGKDRLPWIKNKIAEYVENYKPKYVRLLPNCLEVDKIADRCQELSEIAKEINDDVVFVQYKPPKSPNVCYLGYFHPVLNSDGYVYPCDSCVLNAAANHAFAAPWRICKWNEIGNLYKSPVRSLINNPHKQCPGCVFSKSNTLLEQLKNGVEFPIPTEKFDHPNFI